MERERARTRRGRLRDEDLARSLKDADARITEVIDGDTVRVSVTGAPQSTYSVRLIGIDTPETRQPGTPVECGSKEATSNMLALSFNQPEDTDGDGLLDQKGGEGQRVILATDPTQDLRDGFDRVLAYVQVVGGPQLNLAQVDAGWAKVFVFDRPFQLVGRFRMAQTSAIAANRGVWSLCGGDFHRSVAPAPSGIFGTYR